MIELACPEDCRYLHDARVATMERRTRKLVQHLVDQGKEELIETLKRFESVIHLIDQAIVEVQRYAFRDLTDAEVLEGVNNALKTYETLDRGVIYAHKAESPRIQAITNAILRALDEVRTDLQKQARSSLITTRDYLACLRFVAEEVQSDVKSQGDPRAYLRHSALFHPYPKKETQVIITG